MKKILLSLAVVVAVGAVVAGATGAFFSDTETSTGNTFTAGAIDLGIDNTSYYNGEVNDSATWDLAYNLEEGCENPLAGGDNQPDTIPCLFFDFDDLKPGDWGEDTISIHVNTNDAWLCADVTLTSNDDNSSNEPELGAGDDPEDNANEWDGELAQHVKWYWWADDGDNVFEDDEQLINDGVSFPGVNASTTFTVALADSINNIWTDLPNDPIKGSSDAQEVTYYIGKAWCFGDSAFTPYPHLDNNAAEDNSDPTVRPVQCDGEPVNNLTQTDGMTLDLAFYAEQSRNNVDFVCNNEGGIGCIEKADIMLVLDRSGSMAGQKLTDLKNAANGFVTALSPLSNADGAIVGMSSFSDTGTLNQELTENDALVTTAINALSAGGSTNLNEGISVADTELMSGRNRNDAPNFMVIITDGAPNAGNGQAGAEAAADAAKANGATIFVLGVGVDANTSAFLRDHIATDASHYFDLADSSQLQVALQQLTQCNEGNLVNP